MHSIGLVYAACVFVGLCVQIVRLTAKQIQIAMESSSKSMIESRVRKTIATSAVARARIHCELFSPCPNNRWSQSDPFHMDGNTVSRAILYFLEFVQYNLIRIHISDNLYR